MDEQNQSEVIWHPEPSTPPNTKPTSARHSISNRPSMENTNPNEQSPLLRSSESQEEPSPFKIGEDGDDNVWQDDDEQETKSSWYMLLLTIGSFGLQMGWSVEMSNGSPYLISLGLSKTVLALVWIAGPLSGVLVQPYVGIKSDRSRNKWGKRKPYIIGGGLATVVSLMALAWTRELVGGILGIFGVGNESRGAAITVMVLAVFLIYVLDFAINVLQAAIRAFIVDCAPVHQQESANAWASRVCGVANIFGMFCGGVDLPKYLPFLGNTQFKVLCAIASTSMLVTAAISCTSVQERDPTLEGTPMTDDTLLGLFKDLARSVRRLPPQIMRVCEVQFMAWIGWFPFLFYTTTYIAEMYVDPIYEANPNLSREEADKVWEAGTRRGTFALLLFAMVTFTSSVLLPFIIPPTYQAPITMSNRAIIQPLTPTTEGLMSGSGYFPLKRPSKNKESTAWTRLSAKFEFLLSKLQIKSLTLRRAWLLSHIYFSICMAMTFVVSGTTSATILIMVIGIPWSLTQWAPFALISAEISKRDAIRRGIIRAPATVEGNLQAADEDDAVHQAGVVLGIHNVAISAPQVLATLISSVIFKALAKPRGVPGDNSVAWCMRFGGLCALGAAWLTSRVHEDRIVKKNGGAVVIED
ncbi:hypothetical protein EG328_001144 [Venturia inaequalis]|uniref:Uncharacterized protein n=2 Tax=Venturia inaequalis TaxID=5025 RepID=A0A8H3YYM8_VENIN|nr:hypothetical protein EG328_001144 [Venturia inaequalis]